MTDIYKKKPNPFFKKGDKAKADRFWAGFCMETEKAIRVTVPFGQKNDPYNTEMWIPKSCIGENGLPPLWFCVKNRIQLEKI